MKPVTFKNIMNGEEFVCDDVKAVQFIDGVEYLIVHRAENNRSFLIKKDALKKVDKAKDRAYNIKS
jgi:hypothetical protein